MAARKKKKKKYRMFWFFAKMQLVLLLAVIAGACWYYFGGYAEEVKDLKLPDGMTIGGLVRNGNGMLVSGNSRIEAGDTVMVFCYNVDMKKIENLFN